MLILILIDVLYSQKAVFSFEKGSICQNHTSSGCLHPVKKPLCKISDSPHWGVGIYLLPLSPLTNISKTLHPLL